MLSSFTTLFLQKHEFGWIDCSAIDSSPGHEQLGEAGLYVYLRGHICTPDQERALDLGLASSSGEHWGMDIHESTVVPRAHDKIIKRKKKIYLEFRLII